MGSGKLRTTKIKTFFTNKLNYTLYVERVASYVLINKVELTCAVEVKNTFYDTDSWVGSFSGLQQRLIHTPQTLVQHKLITQERDRY